MGPVRRKGARAPPGRNRRDALLDRRVTGGSRSCLAAPPAMLLSPFQGEGEQGGGRGRAGADGITRRVMSTVLQGGARRPSGSRCDGVSPSGLGVGGKVGRIVPMRSGVEPGGRTGYEMGVPRGRETQHAGSRSRGTGACALHGGRHHSESDEYGTSPRSRAANQRPERRFHRLRLLPVSDSPWLEAGPLLDCARAGRGWPPP